LGNAIREIVHAIAYPNQTEAKTFNTNLFLLVRSLKYDEKFTKYRKESITIT
jgi:hypothetical protein